MLSDLSLSLITIKDSHNRDVMLITNLIEEMKYNAGISFFYQRLNRSAKEESGQELGYIVRIYFYSFYLQ